MPLDSPTPLPGNLPLPPRVLVVDDEPSIRAVARLMLQRAGFLVEEASDATQAVARATSQLPAVIVLDVTLPDRPGTEVIPDLRAAAPQALVLLTSGKLESEFPNHGADGYLPKPFTKDQLTTAVCKVMAAASK